VYEVEAIRGHRVIKGENEYLVKWKGFEIHEATWERQSNLVHCARLLRDFFANQSILPLHYSNEFGALHDDDDDEEPNLDELNAIVRNVRK
jgi:Chromo (CHRromatin Organisation MOdifier) domain